ncbi:DNA cytosine methyltransferase [Streptomyces sp. DSM 3412]|uniref:DNA (cytosine-5-)-methyltransferase n=1 Tax=Streptomyces gottesmaniae TaxID=3075518 RepID=A0ABU2Z922_9ACTN|nr:DNA cytosine methyltransferase [Streptomyces sp. DSM 3412]MDT0572850.1 DNA cytosine methyltransferase [Streptomyces sp. DSM 3412]
MNGLTFVDVCSGAGGLALGLEQAGFTPRLLLDVERYACDTLKANRPQWNVLETDLLEFDPVDHPEVYDVDLLTAGLPRVKSSATVTRRSSDTELRLIEATAYLLHAVQPRALIIENVPTLVDEDAFAPIRDFLHEELEHLGYELTWFIVNAADFGVPQDRRQGVLVALKQQWSSAFRPPRPTVLEHMSVGEALVSSMRSCGWQGADRWAAQATSVAPTLVGGSKTHGGPDFGPSGTKAKWQRMGVYTKSFGNEPPGPDFEWDPSLGDDGLVRITVDQTALLQGFPEDWHFAGGKTARYRQVGNAAPPAVGAALGRAVAEALLKAPLSNAGYTSHP